MIGPRQHPSRAGRRTLIGVALGCACAALAGIAWAGEGTLIVKEAFTPDRLGAATNLSLAANFASGADVPRSPIDELTLYGPAGLGVKARGAGTCTEATLYQRGPAGCPANSRVGFGGGVALVALAEHLVREPFTLDFFFASVRRGHLSLLTYVNGVSPVSTAFVVVVNEIPTSRPYGLGFSARVPRVSTVPGGSYAYIESAFATLGAGDVAYFETVHGRRTLVHIKGLTVPRACPPGGFPTHAAIEFADGAKLTVNPTIPCPRG